MPHLLLIQLIVSFIVGGLLIALQTILAERVAVQWRGMFLSFPSTMALGLFFIGLTKTPADAAKAAIIIPVALGTICIFVYFFALFSRIGLFASFAGAFIVWASADFFVLTFPPKNLAQAITLYFLPATLVCFYLVRKLPQVSKLTPVPLNWKHLTIRSVIGGSIIIAVIVFSKTLGNVWGGLFSAFPAAFSSMFLIYYIVHGKAIIPSVAKSTFFPGSIGFVIY